jgi:hypothetical protein
MSVTEAIDRLKTETESFRDVFADWERWDSEDPREALRDVLKA